MAPSVIINIIMVPQIFPPKFPDKKLRAESQQLQHTDKAEAMFIDAIGSTFTSTSLASRDYVLIISEIYLSTI